MERDTDYEDLSVIAQTHEKVAQDVLESLINPMVMVGANANDVMVLLEAVNAGVLMWLSAVIGENMNLEEVTDSLRHNTLVRIHAILARANDEKQSPETE